jgi:hypothetical protein
MFLLAFAAGALLGACIRRRRTPAKLASARGQGRDG